MTDETWCLNGFEIGNAFGPRDSLVGGHFFPLAVRVFGMLGESSRYRDMNKIQRSFGWTSQSKWMASEQDFPGGN